MNHELVDQYEFEQDWILECGYVFGDDASDFVEYITAKNLETEDEMATWTLSNARQLLADDRSSLAQYELEDEDAFISAMTSAVTDLSVAVDKHFIGIFVDDGVLDLLNGWRATIVESDTDGYVLEIYDRHNKADHQQVFKSDNPHLDAAKMVRDYMVRRASGTTLAAENAEQFVAMMEANNQ